MNCVLCVSTLYILVLSLVFIILVYSYFIDRVCGCGQPGSPHTTLPTSDGPILHSGVSVDLIIIIAPRMAH